MEASLGTFSTPTGVPMKRLPLADISGECRMPIGPGGPRQLGVRTTPSKRSVSPYRSPACPRTSAPYTSRTSLGRRTEGLFRGTSKIRFPWVRSRPPLPPRPSLGPPQPQQAYVGTAASNSTNTEARRAATIFPSLGADIAISALQRSPTVDFLPHRPATRRPAATVQVVHSSLLSLGRVSASCNDSHMRHFGASRK